MDVIQVLRTSLSQILRCLNLNNWSTIELGVIPVHCTVTNYCWSLVPCKVLVEPIVRKFRYY
jgi:hypothetical protein